MSERVLARCAVAPHVRRGVLAAARLTAEGLQIDWYAVVRARPGTTRSARRRRKCPRHSSGIGSEHITRRACRRT